MHKVRAASYLRRTISEPYPRRRPSAVPIAGSGQFARDAAIQLMDSSAAAALPPGFEAPVLTWESDLAGLGMLLCTRLNITLVFVPLGILSAYFNWDDFATFWLNFVGLIPLAALIGNATEELALHTGDLLGGLLNATFGNAVEMIITVQALRAGLLDIVQGSLLGSILSNLLLVLGMSFFCGGLFHHVQKFNAQGATCSTSLLLLASLAFITPTVTSADGSATSAEDVLTISRLTALLIAVTYCLFLLFQLGTHFSLFKDQPIYEGDAAMLGGAPAVDSGELQEDWPTISAATAAGLLFAVTLTVSLSSECLVGSIEGLSTNSGIPPNFIGVILLPIVGNAAEHATAVTVAVKNKPDLTMGVAIGSSTQIAMFMVPFAVLVGWAMGVPMTLAFSKVSATVLTFSILIVIGVVQDGESNWLEGVMLMVAYFIIAIVFWFDGPSSSQAMMTTTPVPK